MPETTSHPLPESPDEPSRSHRCTRPGWQFLVMIGSIFVAELLVMLLLLVFPELPEQQEAFIDALVLTLLLTPALYVLLLRPLRQQIEARRQAEQELQQTIGQLRQALAEVRTLRGILPICSGCKKIRDDSGYWHQVEIYLGKHSGTNFTHGLCPDCIEHYYPDFKGSGPSR